MRRACSGFVRIAGKGTAFPLSSAFIDDEADNEADDEGAEGKAENISAESDDEGGHVELAAVARGGVVVDSLNVSVAAGILLHELLAPRPMAVVQKVEAISNDAESKQSDEVLAQLLSSQRR